MTWYSPTTSKFTSSSFQFVPSCDNISEFLDDEKWLYLFTQAINFELEELMERKVPKIMTELPSDTHKRIQKLSADGDAHAEAGRYPDALSKYWAAWDLLPEPQTDWEAATWLLAAIGDANFLGGDYVAGRDNLSNAMHCPGVIGNPFLHLRLGQCQFELGNEDRAADELARAYMAEGHQIFEDEDPKYLTFLKSKLEPPPGGWEDERKKPWWKLW